MAALVSPIPVTDDEISGEEKRSRVAALVEELRIDLKDVTMFPNERNTAMEQLKVFGRNPENADAIFTPDGIEILTRHCFFSTSPTTSQAALQCLSNALISRPQTRQMFVNLGHSPQAVARLRKPKKDDEFLMSRILFLTSYGTTQNFDQLIDKEHLAEYAIDNIARHAEGGRKFKPKPEEDRALSETLKLVFNVTHFCPSKISTFSKAIPHILKILSCRTVTSSPLQPPVKYLINALINLDIDEKKNLSGSIMGKSDVKAALEKLIEILDTALQVTADADLDSAVVPLLAVLKRLAHASSTKCRTMLQHALLPMVKGAAAGRSGRSEKLVAQLLRHLMAPVTTSMHDAVAALLFELSDEDGEKYAQNVGHNFVPLERRLGQQSSHLRHLR